MLRGSKIDPKVAIEMHNMNIETNQMAMKSTSNKTAKKYFKEEIRKSARYQKYYNRKCRGFYMKLYKEEGNQK